MAGYTPLEILESEMYWIHPDHFGSASILADITNSPYAYVWNDPVNFTDPTGMMGERVGGPKDGPKTVKDCFGSKDYLDDPEKRLSAYIKSKGGVEAFAPQRPKLTKNDWQNKFELWNYNNELTAWKKMSYEQKLQRVRTDVTLQELNQAIRGEAQAMADLFTIQADLGGSGIATGNVSSYFRKWRPLKDNNFVGSLANRLGRYVKAIDEPYSFSGGMGDVDIVTKSFNIEVKSGNKMKITQSLKNKEFSKTEGKDYILYMPKATNKQIYEASKKGIKVIKTEKALIKAIK